MHPFTIQRPAPTTFNPYRAAMPQQHQDLVLITNNNNSTHVIHNRWGYERGRTGDRPKFGGIFTKCLLTTHDNLEKHVLNQSIPQNPLPRKGGYT